MIKEKCMLCKVSSGELKNHTNIRNDGTKRTFYVCRECNTRRQAKYRKQHPDKVSSYVYKSIAKYPDKQKARQKVYYALKKGSLLRPKECSDCKIEVKVEAHHEDYSKPLEVVWVCRSCHKKADKRMGK